MKVIKRIYSVLKFYVKVIPRDVTNIMYYGIYAPRFAQLIYLKPVDITKVIKGRILSRKDTGLVIDGESFPKNRHTHKYKNW